MAWKERRRSHQMTIANNDKKLLVIITLNAVPKKQTKIDSRRNADNVQWSVKQNIL